MSREDLYKKLEDYVAGDLNLEEENQLKQELANDTELNTLLEDEKILVEGIKSWSRKELKSRFQEIENTLEKKEAKTPKLRRLSTSLLAAASVSILIALYFVFNGATSNQELYNNYYEPYTNYSPVTMRGESEEKSTLDEAIQYYEANDYQSAISQLLKIDESSDRDFYLSQSYLALAKEKEAIPYLERLVGVDAQPKSTIKWYLALAYLKSQNLEESKKILSEISTQNNAYSVKASELLEEL